MLTDLVATEAVLKKARCPEDVFGQLSGGEPAKVLEALRHSYRQVVRTVHPDKYTGQPDAISRAQALVGKLTEWRTKAEEKIHAKTYGDNKPHEPKPVEPPLGPQIIQTPKRKYIVTERLAQGDLADLYRCAYTQDGKEHQAVFKIAQSAADNDLLDNEQKALSAIYPAAQPEEEFYRYLPKLLDSFLLRADHGGVTRRVNVLQLADGYVPLSDVMTAYPSGLDYRDAAWIFNRGLEGLWYVHHEKKVIHGAILPTHVLVHPIGHGGKIVDWCYAIRDWKTSKDHVKAMSKAYRGYYPPEVMAKKPVTPQTDIYMLAKCIVALLGGDVATNQMPDAVPKLVKGFLTSCLIEAQAKRPDDAGQLKVEFDDLLHRLVGARQWRGPLAMPAKV